MHKIKNKKWEKKNNKKIKFFISPNNKSNQIHIQFMHYTKFNHFKTKKAKSVTYTLKVPETVSLADLTADSISKGKLEGSSSCED